MSLEEAEEVVEHWLEEPPIGFVIRHWTGVRPAVVIDETPAPTPQRDAAGNYKPRELSENDFARLVASENEFADRYGRVR